MPPPLRLNSQIFDNACIVTTQMRSPPDRDTLARTPWTVQMGGTGRSGDGLGLLSVEQHGAGSNQVLLYTMTFFPYQIFSKFWQFTFACVRLHLRHNMHCI